MEFNYTRKRGAKRTYRFEVIVTGDSKMGYECLAKVHHEYDFKGPLSSFRLSATDESTAMLEARLRVEQDIEDLVGIDE